MTAKKNPCASAQMLIRKPAEEVFEAFINPDRTKHFWFTKGSGRLEAGRTVTWEWEMYHFSTTAFVKEILPNKKIAIEWGNPATAVDFEFRPVDAGTYVTITNYGFEKTGDALVAEINNSAGGFTTVLDGLKAYLEHNIDLNLIADKFPAAIAGHGG